MASSIARRPAVVQKLAAEIVLAYDSVRTSLSVDKSSPYWTDESVQAIKNLHFNSSTHKLYAVYGNTSTGTKSVYGIVRIDVDHDIAHAGVGLEDAAFDFGGDLV